MNLVSVQFQIDRICVPFARNIDAKGNVSSLVLIAKFDRIEKL